MLIGDYHLPHRSFDQYLNAQLDMPSESLSGNTNISDKAEKGVKPKRLNGGFALRKSDPTLLAEFMALAEARDSAGDAIIYTLVHPLAQALRIRKVRFSGAVIISEHDYLHQWDISFTLEEYRSVPEKLANRQQRRTSGGKPASSFEAVLKKVEAQTQ